MTNIGGGYVTCDMTNIVGGEGGYVTCDMTNIGGGICDMTNMGGGGGYVT